MRYLIAGFPAFGADHAPGTLATELEVDPGRLLRVNKDEEPCAGTEIAIVLENADNGTRITVVQSGFGPWLTSVRDTFEAHWQQIVHDGALKERGMVGWSANMTPAEVENIRLYVIRRANEDRALELEAASSRDR